MAIDPSLITTVQVKELPPLPISLTDNFAHEVGDLLGRATIQQLVDFVRGQSASYPYETKILTLPPGSANEYINTNFDMTPGSSQGLGKVDGFWNGWAIHNGNNGTENLDGQTLIGYGANYNTIGQFIGEAEHTLTIPELPTVRPINGSFFYKGTGFGGTTGLTVGDTGTNDFAPGELIAPFGDDQPHNNMQPSFVVLFIMKLP